LRGHSLGPAGANGLDRDGVDLRRLGGEPYPPPHALLLDILGQARGAEAEGAVPCELGLRHGGEGAGAVGREDVVHAYVCT